MITLSTNIVAPIGSYLKSAQNIYSIDVNTGRIVDRDWEDVNQFSVKYDVIPSASIQFFDRAKNSNAISIEYVDTLTREHNRGSAINKHQISLLSASSDYSESVNNRDYALNIIEYGLERNELDFVGYSWAGSFSVLTRTAQKLLDTYGVYVCRCNFIITLGKI